MADRTGRTNITLDPETAALLKQQADSIEALTGFRPTLAQVVRGLITKAQP